MPRGPLEEAHLISPSFLTATLTVLLAVVRAGTHSAPGASPSYPLAGQLEDRGVFVISVAGQPVGTEAFDIRAVGERLEAEAKIELRIEREGKVHEFRTAPKLALDSALQPLTYAWSQRGPQSSQLEVDFRSSPVKARYKTVAGAEDRRDFELPKAVVVLDDNVLHHYQLVVYLYRRTSGGKQTFQAFVPQEALPGTLTVEELGPESIAINGRTEDLRHLVLQTELARIDLWVDDQQHLQRISVPTVQLEAERRK